MNRLHFSFRRAAAVAAASLMLAAASITYAQDLDNPLPATGGTRESVALTIYNQGTALVRDSRTYSLGEGVNILNFTDVASGIDPTSVQFDSATSPDGVSVLEQSYVYDLVDSFALLNRYLDQRIELTTNDGEVFAGELLSGRSGDIILRDDEGQVLVVNISNVRDLRFPELPGGLITRPTLRWLLNSDAAGDQSLELTYLTSGMSWSADYVVLLSPDNTSLDLNGWVTLVNTSGASFEGATVKLIAGDVNRLPEYEEFARMEEVMMMDAVASAVPAEQVEQRQFNEYQLYEIARPVTVLDNETKQVEFVSGSAIPSNTFYVYDASPAWYGYLQSDQFYGATGITDVQNWLEFTTDEDGGVGADLPAGRIRVYQEDVDGSALLIGENMIDHTPEGEEVEIYLGNAFDLVGERTQTDYRIISDRVVEETYEIRLRNRKDDQAVQIRVPENLFRWSEWEIIASSNEYTQLNSNTIEYRVDVPAGGEVVITYTVRYSW
jgi:hypothetical protein